VKRKKKGKNKCQGKKAEDEQAYTGKVRAAGLRGFIPSSSENIDFLCL
jgi:hypothetical protein